MTLKDQFRIEGKMEGWIEGRTEGRIQERYSVALNLLKRQAALDFIQDVTRLSFEEIKKLNEIKIAGRMEGRLEGRIEGKIEGRTEERYSIALNLLQANVSLDIIQRATGLCLE